MQKERRLQKNEHFQHVFRRGSSIANRQLVLYFNKNRETAQFRLGISVSKKIGHAVIRNKMKRLLKEVVRGQAEHILPGHDLVIIVRKPAVDMEFGELEGSVLYLLKKARLYRTVPSYGYRMK